MRKLKLDRVVARRYRNRRVGEFLKELKLTEGRGTGIPDIRRSLKDNGLPPSEFETDADRTWFLSRIPIHPAWAKAQVEAQVGAQVEGYVAIDKTLNETESKILELLLASPLPSSGILAALGHKSMAGNLKIALEHLESMDLVALTIPDKPRSKNQRRMLTEKGIQVLEAGKTAASPGASVAFPSAAKPGRNA